MLPIILASSSPYRRQLLEKLHLPFSCSSPNIDESVNDGETPTTLVERLSIRKARVVSENNTQHLIIASDQVACLGERILTKPGNHKNAVEQLISCSDQTVSFLTGLALLNSATGNLQYCTESYAVKFRKLNIESIERYLDIEPAYDCAGSFKIEGLGIALFEKLQGEDPNSIVGLPLIRLIDFLTNEGVDVLG
ncbi:MAG: MAF protein [Oceanicoccus sp.]|jgi:MAF protein